MSIDNLVYDLENALGLAEEEEDFIQQITRDLEILCNDEKLLNELPTLEKELDKHKALLASLEAERAALTKRATEFEAKTAQLTKQSAEQIKEIQRLEQESAQVRKQLEMEKMAAEQKVHELTQKIAKEVTPAKHITQQVIVTPAKHVAQDSKAKVIELQQKATVALDKCRSVQGILKRHATVYGKQNEQFRKLQLIYKQEKDALARHVAAVKDATAMLPARRTATVTVVPQYKIENVF